ncbi:hypothetical protein JCM8208_007198 [Rhodotorula glutinis]
MHFSTTTTALAAAALALASAPSVNAQGSAAPSASSSSAPSRTSSSSNSTASSTTSSSSAANPLIPSTISPKCQSFLTYLNSHQDISTCTAPLLSALSTFHASAASSDYANNDAAVQDALAGLCYSAPCDDALVRSLLTQFNSNCTTELTASNDVVLGSYDALYVLTPLRDAVCSTDSTADWCINDIAKGSMPAGSTGANATHVVSSVASSYAAAATASIDAGSPTTNETEATFNTTTHLVQSVPVVNNARILAAQDSSASFEIDVPAPPSLYVQITGAVKRLVRRQWNGDSSSSSAWSSAAASASRSGSSAQASASASSSSGANSSAAASNSTSTASTSSLGDDSTTAGVQSFDVPSILPNAATWSSASLPFLFLSPSMSSTVLCSQCTKSILSAYVAWESRMPYALGLANSPLLKGQGSLWTATGEKCGGGFLESVTKQAGETNLTGGAAQGLAVRASGVLGAVVLAATLLFA